LSRGRWAKGLGPDGFLSAKIAKPAKAPGIVGWFIPPRRTNQIPLAALAALAILAIQSFPLSESEA
jgi:hypothetical protein